MLGDEHNAESNLTERNFFTSIRKAG